MKELWTGVGERKGRRWKGRKRGEWKDFDGREELGWDGKEFEGR